MTKLLAIIFLAVFILAPFQTQAGLVPCGGQGQSACTICDIFVLIANIFNFVITKIIPALAVIGIVWGGFVFLTSGGNQEKVKSGRKILLNTVVGLVIAYAAFLIVGGVLGAITTTADKEAFFSFRPSGIVIECPR